MKNKYKIDEILDAVNIILDQKNKIKDENKETILEQILIIKLFLSPVKKLANKVKRK